MIPSLIKAVLEVNKWSETELARYLGTTQGNINAWKLGKSIPQPLVIWALHKRLDHFLIGGKDPNPAHVALAYTDAVKTEMCDRLLAELAERWKNAGDSERETLALNMESIWQTESASLLRFLETRTGVAREPVRHPKKKPSRRQRSEHAA